MRETPEERTGTRCGAGKFRYLLSRGLLSAASLLLLVAVIETLLRIADYDLNRHPEWKYDPSLGWVVEPGGSAMNQVQPSGFRHDPWPAAKTPEAKTLLILGDSMSLGVVLDYAETFPGKLQQLLNEQYGRWQVFNLSVSDWGSAQQLAALQDPGLGYEPDLVVLQAFPFNDFCNNLPALSYSCSLQDYHRPYLELRSGKLRPTSLSEWRTWSRNRSLLFGIIENALDPAWSDPLSLISQAPGHTFDPGSGLRRFFRESARRQGLDQEGGFYALVPPEHLPARLQNGWEVTRAIYARMLQLLTERKIPVLAIVMPFSWTFPPHWDDFRVQTSLPIRHDNATAQMENILSDLQVPTIAMRRQITAGGEPAELFFLPNRDGHLSRVGHARVAGWILDHLQKTGILP